MRSLSLFTFALLVGCKQYAPTIIDETPEASIETQSSMEPEGKLEEVDGPPVGPPPPLLDDGTMMHPPILPPGMKPDPNSNDLVTIYGKNCQSCHGEYGAGEKPGVPNYLEYPQGLNNEKGPMIERILKGHGGAQGLAGKLKPRTIHHLIGYLQGRVGQMRGMQMANNPNAVLPSAKP
jgi:hypothetical protein